MMQQEHKQADLSIRGPKDDFKRQSSELRKSRGIVGADTLDDTAFTHPQLSADPQPGRSVPLEPTVQAPRKIEHTSMADMPFSSIPDSTPATSAPLPASGPSMMEKVGEETGASIEAAKAKLEPLMQPIVAKATSIYEQWQHDHASDKSGEPAVPMKERAVAAGADIKERAAGAAAQAQTMYTEKIAPAATNAAAQAQTMYTEKIAPALSDAAAKAGPMMSNAVEQAKPLLAQASAQAQVAAAQARPVIENAIEQAKPIIANAAAQAQKIYAEQVQPALASGMSAAQEQIGVMREDGLSKTMEKASTATQRRVAAAKTTITETYEAKVPLEQRKKIAAAQKEGAIKMRSLYNRGLDIWETQAAPMLREQYGRAMTFIRQRNLQAPLAIAGIVLTLLLGWSILHALSANRASHEQMVVYQPDWRPSTGPVQGVEMPSTLDKARATITGLDSKIADGIDSLKASATDNIELIKARTADLAQHAQDSVSMGVDSMKVRAAELKESMPSTADIKARMPSTDALKAKAEATLESAKAAMPSTDAIKAQAEATLQSAKAAMPSTDAIKEQANSAIYTAKASIPSTDDIKAKAGDAINSAKAAMPETDSASPSSTSMLRLKINDRIEHVRALLPEHMPSLRARLGQLYDRLTPAQRHYAHAHPEVLNPEDHVIEFIDENGNAKSILDVDVQ